jgi:molybdopterin-guanine dinucleotide biosynthesis protein A
MPTINLNYIRYMIDIIKENKFEGVAACNNYGQIEPLYAFYSTDMLSTFRAELEKSNLRILDAMEHCNIHYVKHEKVREYCKDLSIFTNLNYKSDLDFLEKVFDRQ